MMTLRVVLICSCLGMVGCFGDRSLRCEDAELYASSSSVPPMRVPEGLDVPDESNALQIPGGEPYVRQDPQTPSECLERPPEFFDGLGTDGQTQ